MEGTLRTVPRMIDKLSDAPSVGDSISGEIIAKPRTDPASIRVFPEQGVTVEQVQLAAARALQVVQQASRPADLAVALKQFDAAVMPSCKDGGPLAKAAASARHQIASETVTKWGRMAAAASAKDSARAYLDTLVKTERAWK